jgi:PPK2 family polyphosphate:nucleotide phosphotransferase
MSVDYSPYRVPTDGTFSLASRNPSDTRGAEDKDAARAHLRENRKQMADLQERLYAEGKRSLLVVLQAMDTGGKDSTIRHVTQGLNPQGCHVASFKAPSKDELAHDFLWRIHAHTPPRGHITIFNRSHYEDVLIVRVHGWAEPDLIEQRYGHINDFERLLHDHGTRVVKVMLHISKDYQLERLRRRLERPDKHWKFNPDDLAERALWTDYMGAFELALKRTSKPWAPWYVVSAEKRWYRDLVVSQIMVDVLEDMAPQYPEPDYDIDAYPPDSLE